MMVMKRTDKRFTGVVEHCFSAMRFKVRLDGEARMIAFSLLGVRSMLNDKNQPAMLKFSEEALEFAKDNVYQRDVTVELFSQDKRGTFFGTL
jgi:hypothetical protein